jgi:hypothetical protein
MAKTLIKAREGVYGRQVTEKERELLQRFAIDYVSSTPTRTAADAAALRRLKGKMLLGESHPVSQTQGVRSKAVATTIAKARAGTRVRRKAASAVKVAKPPAKRAAKAA